MPEQIVTHDFFPTLEGYGTQKSETLATKDRTRIFTLSSSSHFVELPHAIKIERVQLGSRVLPEFETRKVRVSAAIGDVESQTFRVWGVQFAGDDHTALLVRTKTSNGGKWQAGVPIRVTGEWDWDAIKADDAKASEGNLTTVAVPRAPKKNASVTNE